MRPPPHAFWVLLLAAIGSANAQQSVAEPLREPVAGLRRPADRAHVLQKIVELENNRRQRAQAKGKLRGLPVRRLLGDGRIHELADFDGSRPLYIGTDNVAAAISTGASLLQSSPYSLNGSGVTIGMWDAGSARITHQEFGTRITIKDDSPATDHATHVGGTLAASGIIGNARGMAAEAMIHSYDWNNDISEMTACGATAPGQADRIYLSNNSYNYISGWSYINGGSPFRVWEWNGSETHAASVDNDFGSYNSIARDQDLVAASAPYMLVFRSAGNDRNNNPATGQLVSLTPGGGSVVPYDPALHPAGDGNYLGGFGTIGFSALAKNVITVGSTLDAVSSSTRDASRATLNSFTAWGPTDDGRIKPDLVANGNQLYSSIASADNAYATYSGTSMATPNACGSAALLIQQFSSLFPGQAMRSSTLKSLLIHTADDRGNPGPDYKYGWGLVNVQAAADLIRDHATAPLQQNIIESELSTTVVQRTHRMVWNGVSPIQATLGWTDPAGAAVDDPDSRTSNLVNDLDLKIIGPDGSIHLPYVMPFVGTWTQASMNADATNGVNHTDNTEQVRIANPYAAGIYQIQVSISGALADGRQTYSIILSGAANEEAPPPPVVLNTVAPNRGLSAGSTTIELSGSNLETATGVRLTRSGLPDVHAGNLQMNAGKLQCTLDLTGVQAGTWNVVADRPGSSPSVLTAAFEVLGALLNESFDGNSVGWSSESAFGNNAWSLSSAASHSPPRSWSIPAPSAKTTTRLASPSVIIPAGAENLQLLFFHNYQFQSRQDGGRLEFSIDGGAWFDVEAPLSGAAFAGNGYTDYIRSSSSSQFAGMGAWTHHSNGWLESVVNLSASTFAGKSIRMRWILATDNSISSANWYLDSVRLTATLPPQNQSPTITLPPFASSGEFQIDPDSSLHHVVRSTSTTLDLETADDGGTAGLSYAWSVSQSPAAVLFSSHTSKNPIVTFSAAGNHQFQVIVSDSQGLSVHSTIRVRVLSTPSALAVTPAVVEVQAGSALPLSATLYDQFGNPIIPEASVLGWTANEGSVTPAGIYHATSAGGPHLVTVTYGNLTANSNITVTASPAATGVELETADSDGDGYCNLVEYAMGSDPNSFTPPLVPVMDAFGLSITFTRPAAITDITCHAESWDGRGDWSPAILEMMIDGEIQTWRARDPLTDGNPSARFLRLRFVRH